MQNNDIIKKVVYMHTIANRHELVKVENYHLCL